MGEGCVVCARAPRRSLQSLRRVTGVWGAQGLRYVGGKLDDVTVVVSRVSEGGGGGGRAVRQGVKVEALRRGVHCTLL